MPTERELQIVITAKNLAEKDLKALREQVKQFGGKMKESTKEADDGLKELLRSAVGVRVMLSRIGFVANAALALTGVAAAANFGNAVGELEKKAIQLGMTTDDLSRKLYGFTVNVETARRLRAEWDLLGRVWESVVLRVGGLTASVLVPVLEKLEAVVLDVRWAWRNLVLGMDSAREATARERGEVEKLATLSEKVRLDSVRLNQGTFEYEAELRRKSYQQQLIDARGNEKLQAQIQANYRREFEKTYQAFGTMSEMMHSNWIQLQNSMANTFTDVFVGAVFRGGSSAKELFRSLLQDIYTMWVRTVMQMIVQALIARALGVIFPGAGTAISVAQVASSFTGTRGGGSGLLGGPNATIQAPGKGPAADFNEKATSHSIGGFQHGTEYVPQTGMYRLHMGEEVVPAGSGGNRRGGGDQYFVQITAVDSKSFVDLVNRNPEAITAIVSKDILLNRGLRKTIRQLT